MTKKTDVILVLSFFVQDCMVQKSIKSKPGWSTGSGFSVVDWEGGAPAPHPLVGMRFPLSNYYVPRALSRFTDDVMACHGN